MYMNRFSRPDYSHAQPQTQTRAARILSAVRLRQGAQHNNSKSKKTTFFVQAVAARELCNKRKMRNAMPDIKVECDQLHVR
jgi:hypothetical protein